MTPTISKSWVQVRPESDFSIQNIPFGIISTASDPSHRPAIAIGEYVLDLRAFSKGDGFKSLPEAAGHLHAFEKSTLNEFASIGRPFHRATRTYLQAVLEEDSPYPSILKDNKTLQVKALLPASDVYNHLPMAIGDYTDFYACRNHAFNVGTLFRGPDKALQPNYNYLPVAYHGRASSVVVSGTPMRRPWGQIKLPVDTNPIQSPSRQLDIELEMGMFVCKGNVLGEPIQIDRAEEHIFGFVLMNDWSARDLQAWEYVPLGPFTGKNLGTTISPWVVLADALEPFRQPSGLDESETLPYLKGKTPQAGLDVNLSVTLISAEGHEKTITKTNARELLWSWNQMVAHHTIAGCNLNTGDLFGSGTISGLAAGSQGSMLEITKGGKERIRIGPEERSFLEDGDTVVIRGWSGVDGSRVGFGECRGTVTPALKSLS